MQGFLEGSPARLDRFDHARDNLGSNCFCEAVELLHTGNDAQSLIDLLVCASLLERALNHLFGAALTPADNDHGDGNQVLQPGNSVPRG